MEDYEEPQPIHVKERKVTWWNQLGGGPLMFAAIFHVVLLIIGAFWIFQVIQPAEKKVDFMPPGDGGGAPSAANKVQAKKQSQITPTSNVKRVFAEGAVATYAIPEQGDQFGEMSALSSLSSGGMSGGLGGSGGGSGFGKGSGAGTGLGMGAGGGKLFTLIPETMRKRCSKEDRLQRLKESGGTPACEDAVMKSLRWMKANQNADGSWGDSFKVSMTGLVLLSYLGHCETPVSEEFGESCLNGIVYLVGVGMKNEGKLGTSFTDKHWCYEHGIAAYAIGEAATFCKELKFDVPNLMVVAEKAGQFIIDNQNTDGGWAYAFATDGGHTDVSIVGWQLQALKAFTHTGIKYKGMNAAVDKGLDYLNTRQAESGGYGYTGTNPAEGDYHTLTGLGMLCHQMWGKGARVEVRKGAEYLRANTKFDYNTEFSDLYGHYYESQAMMARGGEDWKFYNDLFRDQLLNNQGADGVWKVPGGGAKIRGVATRFTETSKQYTIYRNALCTLMLEVYYRFLNTGGGGARGRTEI